MKNAVHLKNAIDTRTEQCRLSKVLLKKKITGLMETGAQEQYELMSELWTRRGNRSDLAAGAEV